MHIRRLALAALALLAGGLTSLGPATLVAADKDPAAVIRDALKSRFNDVDIIDVKPSPVAGIYEVFLGDTIVYSDPTGNYVFAGPLMDTRTRANLTTDRIDERNAVAFETLPLGQAIKVVKGNGKRRMVVFSDPDCPFCKQLERTLAGINDTTVYVLLYPITSLHPDAENKAHAIWCSNDRVGTWLGWMREQQVPKKVSSPCKGDPVQSLQALGKKLYVSSTPTLMFPSGKRISGALPAADLEPLLNAPAAATGAKPSGSNP
jgi:thiol:disulfide interchange protein DsbC